MHIYTKESCSKSIFLHASIPISPWVGLRKTKFAYKLFHWILCKNRWSIKNKPYYRLWWKAYKVSCLPKGKKEDWQFFFKYKSTSFTFFYPLLLLVQRCCFLFSKHYTYFYSEAAAAAAELWSLFRWIVVCSMQKAAYPDSKPLRNLDRRNEQQQHGPQSTCRLSHDYMPPRQVLLCLF